MRELRKETEIMICLYIFHLSMEKNIRNERTPKGDGNAVGLFVLAILMF